MSKPCPVCKHLIDDARMWHPQFRPDGRVELHFASEEARSLAVYIVKDLRGRQLLSENRQKMVFSDDADTEDHEDRD